MAGQVRQDTVQLTVTINGDKAGKTAKEMRQNIRDLNREFDKLTAGTDEYNKKAQEVAQATVRYNQHKKAVRDAVVEIEGAGKKVNPFVDLLKKGAIAFGLFFGVQQVVQWGKQFLHFITAGTVALEDMRDKTLAVFGDAIDIVQDFAVINAQALGVTEEKYASLASEIGAVLVQMGFLEEEAAQMSAEALNVAGAISEWSNGQLTLAQSSEIIQKALQGQTKGLKQIGVSISEVDIKARLLAEGQDKLTGLALKQAKAQATLQLIIERTGKAQAEFAASSEDAGRAVGRIGQYFDQLKENLLSGLLPAYKAITNGVANFLSPLKRESDALIANRTQFNSLIEAIKKGNLPREVQGKLIKQVNAQYPEYLSHLITEKTTQAELNKIQEEGNKLFAQRISLQVATERVLDAERRRQEALDKLGDLSTGVTDAKEALNPTVKTTEKDTRSKFFVRPFTKAGQDPVVLELEKKFSNALSAFDKGQKELEEATLEYEKELARALQAGVDVEKLFEAPSNFIPDDDPTDLDKKKKDALQRIEDLYNRERQLKIRSIEFLRDNEELYAAERARINLEADIKIATAQAQLYKDGSADNLKLLQDVLDKEAQLRKDALELTFSQREEQINRESELTKLAIREEITDKEELTRKLEIEELEAQQRIATVRLAGLKDSDAEYIALYNQITDRQVEIERQKQADQLAINEETIELQRELTLAGIDQLKLDEEDLQKYRQRINLEYDKKILEARLKTFDPDSLDGVKTKNAIADIDRQLAQQGSGFLIPDNVASSGGSSTPADQTKKRDKLQEAADAAIGVASNTAATLLDIERTRIDQQLQSELNAIETLADAKRRAAGDDAVELAKIDAQARAAREKAEKRAAQERKKIAKKEAVIQGALAIVEALPNAFAAIAAGIATALQLAVIDGQSFFYGGPTGSKGIYRDKSGKNVAGVVHTNEYVVPEHIAQDPQHQPVISYLENVRRAKGGFADGGFTNVSTRPAAYVQTVTSTSTSNEMAEIRDTLRSIERLVGAWPREVKARVVYTELEKVGEDLNYIRGQANA